MKKYISSIARMLCSFVAISHAKAEEPLQNWEFLRDRDGLKSSSFEKVPEHILNGTWAKIEKPCIRTDSIGKKEALWFRIKLPNIDVSDPAIQIKSHEKPFNVYQNNELIYSYGKVERVGEKFLGYKPHIFPINKDSEDPFVYFLAATDGQPHGLCYPIEIGSRHEMFKSSMSNLNHLDLIVVFLIASISVLFFFSGAILNAYKIAVFFLGFGLTLSVWLWSSQSGPALKYLWNEDPLFWGRIAQAALYLCPIFLLLFYREVFSHRDSFTFRLTFYLLLLHVGWLFALPLEWSGLVHGYRSHNYFVLFCTLFLFAMLFDSIAEAATGSLAGRIFAIGFLGFVITGVHGILISFRILSEKWGTHKIQCGLLMVCLSVSLVAFVKLKEEYERRKQIEIDSKMNKALSSSAAFFSHESKRYLRKVAKYLKDIENCDTETKRSDILWNAQYYSKKTWDNIERHMQHVIDIETAKPAVLSALCLKTVINESLFMCSDVSIDSRIEFLVHLDHSYTPIGDFYMMYSILNNLITNAKKAIQRSPDNKMEQIQITSSDDSYLFEERVRMSVRNTGSSISNEHLDRVFKEYFTGADSVTDGSGLGLVNVKKFSDLQLCKVEVKSSPSENWTEFTINIPARKMIET